VSLALRQRLGFNGLLENAIALEPAFKGSLKASRESQLEL
jgi:hypothetical protein